MAIIPTTDVNLATEVRDVLNAAGGSVGNNLTSFFKSAAKLNMWSKYKPVVAKQLFHTLDEWLGQNGYTGAYHGDDGKCGLTISTWSTMVSFRSSLESGDALWSYTPPTGGTTQPLRLGDFRGYNTDAFNPIGDISTSGYSEAGDSTTEGDVDFNIEVTTGMDYNLEYSDILINEVPLTEFYLGIYAVKGSSWTYKTSTTKLGSLSQYVTDIPLTTGEWKVIPFLCSAPQLGQEESGTYLSANIAAKTFTIISTNDMVKFTVFGTWNSSKTKVQGIFITVENKGSSAVTLDNIAVSLMGSDGVTDNNVGSPAFSYYLGSSSSTLTVPANTTVTTSTGEIGSITLGDASESYEYFLRATGEAGDKQYSHTYGIEEVSE